MLLGGRDPICEVLSLYLIKNNPYASNYEKYPFLMERLPY